MQKLGSPSLRPMASMRWARSRTAPAFSSDRAADVSGLPDDTARSIFFERPADRIFRIFLRLGRVVARGFLRRDFDMGVGRDHVVGDRHALDDLDALAGQRVVL